MAGERNAGPTRRGGGILGLGPPSTYRPVAGFVPAAPRPLSERDRRDLDVNYRLPGWGMRLQITTFRTKSAGDVAAYASELLDKAKAVFGRHGLTIAVRDLMNVPLANTDGPVTTSEDIDKVIEQVQGNGLDSSLKVIFCARQTANATASPHDAGLTVRDSGRVPYVLINMQASNPDRVTLAHEMGHSAGLHHELDALRSRYGFGAEPYLRAQHVQPDANFMSDTNKSTRADLFAYQVHVLSTAPFAQPGNT